MHSTPPSLFQRREQKEEEEEKFGRLVLATVSGCENARHTDIVYMGKNRTRHSELEEGGRASDKLCVRVRAGITVGHLCPSCSGYMPVSLTQCDAHTRDQRVAGDRGHKVVRESYLCRPLDPRPFSRRRLGQVRIARRRGSSELTRGSRSAVHATAGRRSCTGARQSRHGVERCRELLLIARLTDPCRFWSSEFPS